MFSETWASTAYLYGSNKRIRASDKARMTPGEESRTGMIKIPRVWDLILDVALENTDKARTRQIIKRYAIMMFWRDDVVRCK